VSRPARSALERVRTICLALPDTEESLSFGKPHFKVAGKIFAGCEEEDEGDGPTTMLGFKLGKPAAAALIAADPRCAPAAYVGKHGWVSMRLEGRVDWDAVRQLVETSYRLIAPRAAVALLDGEDGDPRKRAASASADSAPVKAARKSAAPRGAKKTSRATSRRTRRAP
jgi:predicted DNA-binding protein (MmcQ/YjbR family)